MDVWNCQTLTATPAEPGELPRKVELGDFKHAKPSKPQTLSAPKGMGMWNMNRKLLLIFTILTVFGALSTQAAMSQGIHESLGTAYSPHTNKTSLIAELMKTLPSSLKPQLMGVHPRVYFTSAELAALRLKAHGPEKILWQKVLQQLSTLPPPPPAPAQKRRAQNNVAEAIAALAFAYKIEGNPKYLRVAEEYMNAAVGYTAWGYTYSKPNVDLAAGILLYGMGVGYDLLYHNLTPAEREKYRDAIAYHGHLLYEHFKPRPGIRYTYSQNHTYIPMAGLGIAAYAVYGEVPEAAIWAALSRAIYQRVLQTYSKDGYYYEGYEYWTFATPWIIHYLDALQHSTGQDLFNQPGLRKMYLYALFGLLPGNDGPFDFGDVYDGPLSRNKTGEDYPRSHPGGHFLTNYNILYDLARHFQNPKIQGVADWMHRQGLVNAEPWWTLVWKDDQLASTPIRDIKPWHYFPDHGVVYWRSGWGANATAIAFKCGPPEGHSSTEFISKYPGWKLSEGHAHPDVNSFILFAHGTYLTGESGYAGVPMSYNSNTLTIDGRGQGHEGKGHHDAWAKMPYTRLNLARIVSVHLDKQGFNVEGEGAGAYAASTGMKKYLRHIWLVSPGHIEVSDSIESSKPSTFTEYLHADVSIKINGKRKFAFYGVGGKMGVYLQSPPDAVTKIEPNIVMGPGRPGSVNEGQKQLRGYRVAASTKTPKDQAHFIWELSY